MKRFTILSIMALVVVVLAACGEESENIGAGWSTVEAFDGEVGSEHDEQVVDPSLLTPEADGTFSMAPTATPEPTITPIPEPTATPAPTNTPTPTFEDIYREDVVSALHAYYVAYHSRSQSALDSVTTAATSASEFTTVEYMKSTSAGTRGWSDYPDIEITEITHLKCDEVLCKIWFDGISNPPVENPERGQDFPFDIEVFLYFRLVDGVFLEDHTHDTYSDEWQSTHRP